MGVRFCTFLSTIKIQYGSKCHLLTVSQRAEEIHSRITHTAVSKDFYLNFSKAVCSP